MSENDTPPQDEETPEAADAATTDDGDAASAQAEPRGPLAKIRAVITAPRWRRPLPLAVGGGGLVVVIALVVAAITGVFSDAEMVEGPDAPAPLVTLEDLPDAAFRARIKALGEAEKAPVVLAAVAMIDLPLTEDNLAHNQSVVDFLEAVTIRNGHVRYLKGELERRWGRRDEGHGHFRRYLAIEAQLTESERGGGLDPALCAERVRGVCPSRTALICHTLANDLYEDALKLTDAAKRQPVLEEALLHANCTLLRIADGLRERIPSSELKRRLLDALEPTGG